jgi:hypothetical protein
MSWQDDERKKISEEACGGPAFPNSEQVGDMSVTYGGMSLRDYFAAKAMQGLATTFEGMTLETIEESIPVVAKISMAMADAMLAERAK